jgi:predicted transcriptional regulator
MPRRAPAPPPLGELEAEVMEVVWRRGSATVRDVLDDLNASDWRQRRYTTVLTVMHRLHAKRLLARRREGRRDLFAPAIERDRYLELRAAAQAGALVDEYGDMALAHFARHLDQLDPKRRAEIRRLAERD